RDITGNGLFMHASGKGYSPSEIDPTYALQNAFAAGYFQLDNAGQTTGGTYDATTGEYTPGDNSGPVNTQGTVDVSVSLTQLRNILAGARSQDNSLSNGDRNFVMVNGQPMYLPNGVYDAADTGAGGVIPTATMPVPGRWGEADAIPQALTAPAYFYTNPV